MSLSILCNLRNPAGCIAILLLAILTADTTEAQRMSQYGRAMIDSPQVMARGGAGVAFRASESALFYNPAQLSRMGLNGIHLEVLGVQPGMSNNLLSNIHFVVNEVIPAVEDGFSFPPTAEEQQLFDDAIRRGQRATLGMGSASIPTVFVGTPLFSVGGGVYGDFSSRLLFHDIGQRVPLIDMFNQLDIITVLAASVDIPSSPVAAGLSTRIIRRYLASIEKELLDMSADEEQMYVLAGTSAAIDFGLHIEDVVPSLPGQVDLGLAVYDLIGGTFSYSEHSTIGLSGTGPSNQAEIDQIIARLDGRDGRISMQIGAAYHFEIPGSLARASLGVDWLSRSTTEESQSFLSGFRIGGEAALLEHFTVRTGLSQGYPSVGFGVKLPFFAVDYAYFGVEEGLPGNTSARFLHLLNFRLGIFKFGLP